MCQHNILDLLECESMCVRDYSGWVAFAEKINIFKKTNIHAHASKLTALLKKIIMHVHANKLTGNSAWHASLLLLEGP